AKKPGGFIHYQHLAGKGEGETPDPLVSHFQVGGESQSRAKAVGKVLVEAFDAPLKDVKKIYATLTRLVHLREGNGNVLEKTASALANRHASKDHSVLPSDVVRGAECAACDFFGESSASPIQNCAAKKCGAQQTQLH
ncbi:unnamed protein product, partial [Amoebophrya sp. A25]